MTFRNIVAFIMMVATIVGMLAVAISPIAFSLIGAAALPMIPCGALAAIIGGVGCTSI